MYIFQEDKYPMIISANAKTNALSAIIFTDSSDASRRMSNSEAEVQRVPSVWMPAVLFLRQQRKSVTSSATGLFLNSSTWITSLWHRIPINELIELRFISLVSSSSPFTWDFVFRCQTLATASTLSFKSIIFWLWNIYLYVQLL